MNNNEMIETFPYIEKEPGCPTILFDFGGVIVKNGFWDWVSTITSDEDRKKQFGVIIDAADAGKVSEDVCFQELSELANITSDEVKEQLFSSFTPNEEVVDILKQLRERHYTLVLVTNFMQTMANTLLDQHDLRKYFSQVFISSQLGLVKPSPEFFRSVINTLGVNTSELIFIDDSQRNAHTAIGEGIERTWIYVNPQLLSQRFQDNHLLPPDTTQAIL